jgi:mannose-6-phosphate isomerase-like protein (cupin superfamily)
MARLDEDKFKEQLRRQRFSRVYVWQDAAGALYREHTHEGLTAHIILDGEMTLSMRGGSKTYRAGERCDVPAGAVHAARMGPGGCRYLIGEKQFR